MEPTHISRAKVTKPTRVLDHPLKQIDEVVGKVATDTDGISIAIMHAKKGWTEPGQTPEFMETVHVLSGSLTVEFGNGSKKRISADEMVVCYPHQWVRFSTPSMDCSYSSVCVPAFTHQRAHRDVV